MELEEEEQEGDVLSNVDASDADSSKILDAFDHFVEDLAGVGFEASSQFNGVGPSFGIFA
jgi:hypothetical protein